MLNLKDLMVKLLQGIFEYLLLFPLFLIIGINMVDGPTLWMWLISIFLLFTIGVIFKTFLSDQKWWVYGLFSIVIGVLSSLVFGEHILFLILLVILYPVVIYRGIMYASRTWDNLLPISFLWMGGCGIYFVSFFFFRYNEILNPYLKYITVCGAILIVLTMFISNREHLKSSTLSKEKEPSVSKTIKNQNRLFLIVTIMVIAVITNGQMIREALWNGFKGLIQWLIHLLSSDSREIIEESPAPPISTAPVLPVVEQKEPSAIALFLDAVMIYVMYAFVFVAVIVLVLLLIKQTRGWVKKVIGSLILFLKGMISQSTKNKDTEEYVDETESLFNWKEWSKVQQEKAKGIVQHIFQREPNWKSLTDRQKIRFVYRKLLLQEIDHINYKPAYTSREMLEEIIVSTSVDEEKVRKLQDVYEQTRYGEKPVDEHVIEEIYSLIRKK